jgi:PAS domain-containing protein
MHTNTGDTERGSEAVTNNDPHFRNLVDNALTGIIDNTLEGKILFAKQALARMLEFESPQQMQAEDTLLQRSQCTGGVPSHETVY